jgi:hypothetical protein
LLVSIFSCEKPDLGAFELMLFFLRRGRLPAAEWMRAPNVPR